MSVVDQRNEKIVLHRDHRLWDVIEREWAGDDRLKWKGLACLHLYVHNRWTLEMIGNAFGHPKVPVSRLIQNTARVLRSRFTMPEFDALEDDAALCESADNGPAAHSPANGRLTDAEWNTVGWLIPDKRPGPSRPRTTDVRRVLEAILYRHRQRIAWRFLPPEFPSWGTVYTFFRHWRNSGVLAQIGAALGLPDLAQQEPKERDVVAAGQQTARNRWTTISVAVTTEQLAAARLAAEAAGLSLSTYCRRAIIDAAN